MSDTPNFETCNMDVGCQEHEKCFAAQNGSPENCGAFGPVNGNKNDTSLENWFPYSAEELNRLERENAALRAELEQVRKDADRYRHLRDHGGADLFGGTASMSIGRHPMIVYFAPSLNHANVVSLFAENADYMVDAAIDAVKGEK